MYENETCHLSKRRGTPDKNESFQAMTIRQPLLPYIDFIKLIQDSNRDVGTKKNNAIDSFARGMPIGL